MLQTGLKILHTFVLLSTLTALIGVNVRQLCCCHSKPFTCEIQLLPEQEKCPCDEENCGQDCRDTGRHDFYKITDFSKTEEGIQLQIAEYIQPEFQGSVGCCVAIIPELNYVFPDPVPDLGVSREFLCTYLC